MKKKTRRIVMILLALVLIVSGSVVVSRQLQYRQGEEDYADAADLAGLPDLSEIEVPPPAVIPPETEGEEPPAEVWVDPYADALAAMDFTALRAVNSDVLGWILIPDTVISYPMVQGSDNSYYLKHTWRLSSSVVGAIFMEAQCSADFSDFNTIIYGHRMNNGSMFAGLAKYKNISYYKNHPTVYITDDAGSRAYQIFAAYEVSVTGDTYRLGLTEEADKQAYIDYCLSQSLYDPGIVPTVYDSIVTLSTCTGRGHATRWVVQAVLRGEAPPEEAVPDEGTEDGETVDGEVVDGEVIEPPAGGETSVDTEVPADTTPPADTETPAETPPPVTDIDSETIPAA